MPDAFGNMPQAELIAAQSPLTQAGIQQFQAAQLPILQQQAALQGLGNSPALQSAIAGGLAQALPNLIGQGQQLTVDAATRAAQLQQQQLQTALQALQGAGQLQRGITQEQLDAQQMERLRLQGLSEQATTGLFGSSVLPNTFQQSSQSSSSK